MAGKPEYVVINLHRFVAFRAIHYWHLLFAVQGIHLMLRAQTEFAAYPRVATKFVYCCFLAFFAFQADENASAILRLWNEFPIGVAVLTLAGISVQNEYAPG